MRAPIAAIVAVLAAPSLAPAGEVPKPARVVDFNREVRPILSNSCFLCHGPDPGNRKGVGKPLRLDTEEGATADLNGLSAIVRGKPDESEAIARITSDDPSEVMPPPGHGKKLGPAEVEMLTAWIAQGARYETHWSYRPPVRPTPPPVRDATWSRNEVDRFLLARLDKEGLAPSPEADREALIRRVSLDLLGLPPTPEEVDAFVADKAPDAYETLVDRLLARPAYGEHWGKLWLDLARYADSAGYADDPARTIWGYRDYVVRSFNANTPFDRFTVEQIAGDLLPNPTDEQRVATAFHRNTLTNNEGGTNDEEFRNVAVVDRVNTTMAVWMGTTIACAQCHDHKYDPLSQAEYFRLFAVFNNTEDADRTNEAPVLALESDALKAKRADLAREIAGLDSTLKTPTPALHAGAAAWADAVSIEMARLVDAPACFGVGAVSQGVTGIWFASSVRTGGAPTVSSRAGPDLPRASGAGAADRREAPPRFYGEVSPLPAVGPGLAGAPGAVLGAIATAPVRRTDAQREAIRRHYIAAVAPELQPGRVRLAKARAELAALKPETTVPVLRELAGAARRKTKVQRRGNYLELGDEVPPGVPAAFPPLPAGTPADRLGLARWLVADANPLTARVVANRYWEQIFGIGLVATSEEFGAQGDQPSHPELLDWLATELVRGKWDLKRFLRVLVTSAAYRQSSKVTPDLIRRDPDNRLLARGPRFRLSAETIRDQALAVSGLLSPKMFGPPVKPPQPSLGLTAAFGSKTDWETSAGEDKFRRGIYTTWRRSSPYPSMATFDAPNREVCTLRRTRTNTPLQALVTLNDPVYVEAAQALARRMVAAGPDPRDRARLGVRLALSRRPNDAELDRLVRLAETSRSAFEADRGKATKVATEPLGPAPKGADVADLAAWTVVGNVLLNLDEVLMKR